MGTEIDQQTGERRVTAKSAAIDTQTALTSSDLEKLWGYSREELIALVRRIGNARWAEVIMMTPEQRVDAIVDNLCHTALTSADKKEARESGKEALNRIQGTSVQRIEQKTMIATVDMAEMKRLVDRQAEEYLERIANL